jgi:hypothetical protein
MPGELRKIGRLIHGLYPPGLNAREIKQCVDELEQAQTVAVDQIDPSVVGRRDRCAGGLPLHLLERAQHQS